MDTSRSKIRGIDNNNRDFWVMVRKKGFINSVSRGKIGERLAEEYLISRGYIVLAKNWRGAPGRRAPEIDLIVRKNETIVFVEVKTASSSKFGSPAYWITESKRKRLTEGALAYIAENSPELSSFRFDVIVIDNRARKPLIKHIADAFMAYDE